DYPVMSGSNLMCVATVLLETGMVPMHEPQTQFTLESPAGVIRVTCQCSGGKVTRVSFVNQPAFVFYEECEIRVPGYGALSVDVSYGGETFVQIDAQTLGLRLEADEAKELSELGELIKRAANQQLHAVHPMNTALSGITQTQFMGPLTRTKSGIRSRNAVVVSPGRIDRSPGGTGTSARLALMHRRKQIAPGETLIHESIIGTSFEGKIEQLTQEGPYPAVVTSVAGQAWMTGMHQICLDPGDPLAFGYTLPDTWPHAY
ncbi:proline racemase family protein, partial [Burkholderia diffusa]